MAATESTGPSGPVMPVRSAGKHRTYFELHSDTELVTGVFPAGSGYLRIGGSATYLDLIVQDEVAARQLRDAIDMVLARLDGDSRRLAEVNAATPPALRAVPDA